jgi:molybdopterin converting factor subunit 1
MDVHVRLFAIARDLAGTDSTTITIPPDTEVSRALERIIEQFPRLREWKDHVRVAVNCEYVAPDHLLRDDDEMAIIPPVSGG